MQVCPTSLRLGPLRLITARLMLRITLILKRGEMFSVARKEKNIFLRAISRSNKKLK